MGKKSKNEKNKDKKNNNLYKYDKKNPILRTEREKRRS